MALPKIDIDIVNGGLGLFPSVSDNTMGLVLMLPDGVAAPTPASIVINSLKEIEELGIAASTDTADAWAWRHVRDFYREAPEGAELHLVIVEADEDLAASIAAIEVLVNNSNGKVPIVGLNFNPASGFASDDSNGIEQIVLDAISPANNIALSLADAFKPIRVIIEGYGASDKAAAPALQTYDSPRTAVFVGNDEAVDNPHASIGYLLGRYAKIPVQRKPSRVKDGAVAIVGNAFVPDVDITSEAQVGVWHDKGFITLRRFVNKAGYFFSYDHTCAEDTSDYRILAHGRVIDKAIKIIYALYLNEIEDEIVVDDQGFIPTAMAKYFENLVANAINQAMTATGEISGVTTYVDPATNVISTGKLCIQVRIRPVGYSTDILVELGLYNPFNN